MSCPWPCPVNGPWVADHVSDRVLLTAKVALVVELVVQDAIKPIDLVRKPGHRIGLVPLIVDETTKVAALTGFRTLVCHLPHHPLHDIVPPASIS